MAVLLEAEECLGRGVDLGSTLQHPQQDGSCQHRKSSPWHALEVSPGPGLRRGHCCTPCQPSLGIQVGVACLSLAGVKNAGHERLFCLWLRA